MTNQSDNESWTNNKPRDAFVTDILWMAKKSSPVFNTQLPTEDNQPESPSRSV